MELFVALAFFTLHAILGPWVGVDSIVPGGWTPTDPRSNIWPDRPAPSTSTRHGRPPR